MQVIIDPSKVTPFLEDCSKQFEQILDAEDARDGAVIEGVLKDMQACEKAPIVERLVHELYYKERAAKAA